jgi:hypothetical protein
MMKHATSESDVTSLTTSPPLTPKTPKRTAAYYVQQSPPRDSQSSSTAHTTPVCNNNSPLESPARHTRAISPRSSSSKRPNNSGKEWRAIVDEEEADKKAADELPKLCVAAAFWLSVVLVLVFTMVCLVVWGAARQYRPRVMVKKHDHRHGL